MAKAASHNLTRANVISILKLTRVPREKQLSPKDFISSIKDENWLKTTHGYRSPADSVLKNSKWTKGAEQSVFHSCELLWQRNCELWYRT